MENNYRNKSDRILTTKELADYMKLNEKTILKMVQNGEIPGVKVGSQWRFHLAAIDHHLQRDIVRSSENELDALIRTAHHIIPLSRLVDESLIRLDLEANDRDEVLFELAKTANEAGVTPDAERLFSQLKKREDLLSTAVGNGVALPHPRNPNADLFKKPNILIARSSRGVDFSAADRKKVHLFFMSCAPNVAVHLRLLAKVSKMLRAKDVVQRFVEAPGKDDIMRILLELEKNSIIPNNET